MLFVLDDVYSEDKTQSEVVEDVETKIGLDTLAICDGKF